MQKITPDDAFALYLIKARPNENRDLIKFLTPNGKRYISDWLKNENKTL